MGSVSDVARRGVNHCLRFDPDVWEPAVAKAESEGFTITDIIVNALMTYTAPENDGKPHPFTLYRKPKEAAQ